MLRRDWRAGELRVLVAALVLAVASVGTVGFFADRVKGALTRQANLLLGGDLMISGDRPLPSAYAERARNEGLASTPVVRFNSMIQRADAAAAPGAPAAILTDVKAVGEGYPLRGAVRLQDPAEPDGRIAKGIPASGEAWVDLRLAQRLGVEKGAKLVVGESTLVVGEIVQQEPEVAGVVFALGPKLLMNQADVPATNLMQPGNRASHRLLIAAPTTAALERYRAWLAPELKPGQRMETVRDLRARGAPDARARREVPRPRGARGRAARRGGRRARRIALPAAPSRCCGDAALPRRHPWPRAGAVRAAVRAAGRARVHRRRRTGPGRAGTARAHARGDHGRRVAGADLAAGARGVRHRPPAAVRLRAAAAGRAGGRAAAARASSRPAAPEGRRRARLCAGRRHRGDADRMAGPRSAGGRDHGRGRGRAAARLRFRGVGADRAAQAPAAGRGVVALRAREPVAPALRLVAADRRARAGPDGAAAAHAGPRRPHAGVAREPSAGRAQPVPRQRAAGPGGGCTRDAVAAVRARDRLLADGARPAGGGERRADRHCPIHRGAGAPARRARVQPVVDRHAARRQPRRRRPRSGAPTRRARRPACRSRTASRSRSA